MIKTELLTINGKEFVRTYSDTGKMLERDGVLYEEAYDPADSGRTYTEVVAGSYHAISVDEYKAIMAAEEANINDD